MISIILFSNRSLTKFSLFNKHKWRVKLSVSVVIVRIGQSMPISHLLPFSGRNLQREARPPREIYIIVEDSAKINEIIHVVGFHSVAYLFLNNISYVSSVRR